MCRRTRRLSATTSWPANPGPAGVRAQQGGQHPDAGVLPAPFGPSRHSGGSGRDTQVQPVTAAAEPNDLASPQASIIRGSGTMVPLPGRTVGRGHDGRSLDPGRRAGECLSGGARDRPLGDAAGRATSPRPRAASPCGLLVNGRPEQIFPLSWLPGNADVNRHGYHAGRGARRRELARLNPRGGAAVPLRAVSRRSRRSSARARSW